MPNLTTTWQFWALLSAVFAAATAILAKVGVDEINPDFATFIRTVVVLVALAVLVLVTHQYESLRSVSHRGVLFLSLSGLATGASWLCYFRALRLGTASQVAPLDKLSVLLVAIFGAFMLGERLSLSGWLGVVLVAAGAVLIMVK